MTFLFILSRCQCRFHLVKQWEPLLHQTKGNLHLAWDWNGEGFSFLYKSQEVDLLGENFSFLMSDLHNFHFIQLSWHSASKKVKKKWDLETSFPNVHIVPNNHTCTIVLITCKDAFRIALTCTHPHCTDTHVLLCTHLYSFTFICTHIAHPSVLHTIHSIALIQYT